MAGLRIWHLLAAVGAAALLFTVARFDTPCTPMAPVVALNYLCGVLGIYGARWRGRRGRTGLWLGLLLGPLGLLFACSRRAPEGWPERAARPKSPDPSGHTGRS